ncbi:MAG: DnaA regulatory inactivator Hda [Pseudomonadales bacterium]|nr:DnaA regulatory inactivator Hda [Pseudomonadales bacterium]
MTSCNLMVDLFSLEQLSLPLAIRDEDTFANFLAKGNEMVLSMLNGMWEVDKGDVYFLFGANSSGKTHLLQAACHDASQRGMRAIYFPARELIRLEVEILQGCETLDLVCVDDVEILLGDPEWELGLFTLYNRLKDSGKTLLISSACAVTQLNCQLADLKSRLQHGVGLRLLEPDEHQKAEIFQFRARLRGLEVSEEVMTFIMRRSQRSLGDLLHVLQKLDDVSLSAKRKLTVPFVKQSLGW